MDSATHTTAVVVIPPDDAWPPIQALRQRYDRQFRRWMPHITLLYDGRGIGEHVVEPVRWTVKELVLVHSLLGQSRYIPLGRWSLRGH